MQLTLTEQHYLQCLAEGMTFEQMAIVLGITVQEVEDFGTEFFDRAFEICKRNIN